jgi:hypothetical protein
MGLRKTSYHHPFYDVYAIYLQDKSGMKIQTKTNLK